ncbi:hypothetical protein AB0E96_26545 [Kitasatospora sp. NPDC036755]|uniref:hypothetical protein n=1 Tax=Kitasatospora sp. NPDC036755 TaxID=3154600 RepID=UPI0033CDC3D1
MAVRKRSHAGIYQPQIGEVVKDRANRGGEGVYMETRGGLAYLRPRRGGIEWTTLPGEIEQSGRTPELVPVYGPDRPRRTQEGSTS